MQIFIMRHGEASLHAASDALRPLTEQGKTQSIKMAVWLAEHATIIDKVLISPYLRAQQTLASVKTVLDLPQEVETLKDLTPDGNEGRLAAYLQVLAEQGVGSVLVISHLPLVGYLVSLLCPGVTPPMFATSSIVRVDLDPSTEQGILVWQHQPSLRF